MKYVIMADGKGTRWKNYKNIPKHLIKVDGEILLERIVKQLNNYDRDAEVIITSHDERYEFEGATRYEPLNNVMEIDRFTEELIEDNMCFLYGDTYYTDKAIRNIVTSKVEDILFFGNKKSIVAIKIKDSEEFKKHVSNVRNLFLQKKIKNCKGWQVYQSFQNLTYDVKQIKDKFIIVDNDTIDYNTPKEYEERNQNKVDDNND